MLTLLIFLTAFQDSAQAQDSTDFRAMLLCINSGTTRLIVDEPLSVFITVGNPTERALKASFFLQASAASLRVLVSRENGKFEEFRHWGCDPALVVGAPVTLEPKKLLIERRVISQGEGCLFCKPGVYRVKAELQDSNKTVLTSNELEVRVEETPAAETAAWTFLKEKKLLGVLGADAADYGTDTHLDALRGFVEQYPKSRFAPSARLSVVLLTLGPAMACKKEDERVERLNALLKDATAAKETCHKDLLADLLWVELSATICLRKYDEAVKLMASFKEASVQHPRRSDLPSLEDQLQGIKPR